NIDKLKDVKGNGEDFSGKVIVFCKDFRQVLTVIYRAISTSLEHKSRNNPNFSEFLLRVGKGEKLTDTKYNIKIPKEMIIKSDNKENSILRLIRHRKIITFNNFDEVIDDTNYNYEDNVLNSLTSNGLPSHKLVLKKKKIVFGQHTGKFIFITRVSLSLVENKAYPFEFRRKQFHIKICFVMIIKKAHGQIIQNVGVYLPRSVSSQY
ncbi:hypothetical protein Pfo_019027, partial [Paulownia fortunei]